MANKNILIDGVKIDSNIPTLVSFSLCPFVQRSVITMNIKQQKFDRIDIDLINPPEWFNKLIPTGKVPALLYNDDLLFESAVINEFIDEIGSARLQEQSSWDKAKERAWICFVGDLISNQYRLLSVTDEENYHKELDSFISDLIKIGSEAGEAYFSQNSFGLLDAAIAPLFTRLKLTPAIYQALVKKVGEQHNLIKWIDNLTRLDAVKNSVNDEFDEQFVQYFKSIDGYIFNELKLV